MPSLSGCSREQTQFDGTNSSLSTVRDTELGEDVHDVDFDCAYTNSQVVGNLPVGLSLREQLQHFTLTGRQPPGGQFLLDSWIASQALKQSDHEVLVQD